MAEAHTFDTTKMTETTRSQVSMAAHCRITIEAAEPGRVKLSMPKDGNTNHIGTIYAGALYTLAEIPGGTLFSTTFDTSRYYPIIKEQNIRFRRPATTDITVEMTMTADEATEIAAQADEHGNADYNRVVELIDADGTVVAISTNSYQMRTFGS
jgi:acyl-coenzyme A thioesterase PaaI-like protein